MNPDYENLTQDGEDLYDDGRWPRWWSPRSLLTTETSAITAFVLAVLALMGFVGFPVAEALVGVSGGPETMGERNAISAMVVLLVVLGSCWLSQRVLHHRTGEEVDREEDTPAWPRHLAGAAAMIAAVAAILSIVTIFGGLFLSDVDMAYRLAP